MAVPTGIAGTPIIAQPAEGDDTATAASNTAVSLEVAGVEGKCWNLDGVMFSYSGVPTGGQLEVIQLDADGADDVTVLDVDITAAGPGPIVFPRAKRFTSGMGFRVALAAGGSGVVGKLTILGKWTSLP